MSAVSDVLNGAADLIERDGWVQGIGYGQQGERCAEAALSGCASDFATKKRAAQILKDLLGVPYITAWNDAPGRTKDEVVVALRAAAERAA